MTEPLTTCQVCGRAIKANTGLTAHHGYRRPGSGWQTTSCFGARYRPYEEAHDRLDEFLVWIANSIATVEGSLYAFREFPPATISYLGRTGRGFQARQTYIQLTRPEGFDGTIERSSYRPSTYEGEHAHYVYTEERSLREMAEALKYGRARRAAWLAPKYRLHRDALG